MESSLAHIVNQLAVESAVRVREYGYRPNHAAKGGKRRKSMEIDTVSISDHSHGLPRVRQVTIHVDRITYADDNCKTAWLPKYSLHLRQSLHVICQ